MRTSAFVFLSSLLVGAGACGGDPPPPAAGPPPASVSSAPPAVAQDPAPPSPVHTSPVQTSPVQTSPFPAATAPGDPGNDVVACLQKAPSGTSNPACAACGAASCAAPMRALGNVCPDFRGCVCGGKSMTECAPTMMNAACMEQGKAVGACMHQSCAAQCAPPGTTAQANGSVGAGPAQPATDADGCAALTACCAQLGPSAPPMCAKAAATNMPQACGAVLRMFRSQGQCH